MEDTKIEKDVVVGELDALENIVKLFIENALGLDVLFHSTEKKNAD